MEHVVLPPKKQKNLRFSFCAACAKIRDTNDNNIMANSTTSTTHRYRPPVETMQYPILDSLENRTAPDLEIHN
jgi:hypothetical protein